MSQTQKTKNKENKETQSENKKLEFKTFSIFQAPSTINATEIKK